MNENDLIKMNLLVESLSSFLYERLRLDPSQFDRVVLVFSFICYFKFQKQNNWFNFEETDY